MFHSNRPTQTDGKDIFYPSNKFLGPTLDLTDIIQFQVFLEIVSVASCVTTAKNKQLLVPE